MSKTAKRALIYGITAVVLGLVFFDAAPVFISHFNAETRAHYVASEGATAVRQMGPSSQSAMTAYMRAEKEAQRGNGEVLKDGFRVNSDKTVTLVYIENTNTHWFKYVPGLKDLTTVTRTVTHGEREYASS